MGLSFEATGDSELSLTLHNRRAQIIDNIFTGTPTLNMLRSRNGVEIDGTGGHGIVRGLRFSKNGTADSFSGYDTYVISPQDNETSANFPWASLWAHVSVAWDEERRNSGDARLINLVNQKIDDAEMSLRDELNGQLTQAQPAAASKDMIGLNEMIDADDLFAVCARIASHGGIDQSSATWWRNVLNAGADGTAAAAFTVAAMHALYNDVSDGSDFPTFILSNQAGYEAYEASQVGLIRYAPADVMDASFSALMFKQTPITWDGMVTMPDVVPTGTLVTQMYFINTTYTKLVIHSEGQFVTSDFIEPDNGAFKTAKILLMAQLICTNRRRNGTYIAAA